MHYFGNFGAVFGVEGLGSGNFGISGHELVMPRNETIRGDFFRKGDMVAPFDKAVFGGPLLKIQGPVKTKFGFHLIKVLYRS